MKSLFNALFLLGFALVILSSCKNSSTGENVKDTSATDSAPAEPKVLEHKFPESPVNATTDTTFKTEGKTHRVKLVKKTIDTVKVVFERKAMGKMVRDVYYDYKYFITPVSPAYTGTEIKVTKHNFKDEFNEEFFNYAILYSAEILGYNTTNKEYEFSFMINKPDTESTFKIYFFINNKGEIHYEVEDIEA